MKHRDITFLPYDPKTKYRTYNNWVLIASMGDPSTWQGGDQVEVKKGNTDGLAYCLSGLDTLQGILYKRPSGIWDGDTFTNHMHSILLADSNSVVGRKTILE